MRQVQGLWSRLQKKELTEFYNSILSYKMAFNPKLPSLEEFLSLSLGNTGETPNSFDEKTDKFLEEQALKRLEERRRQNG